MNRTILEYDSSTEFLMKILEYDPKDVQLMCPYCGSELIFAPTWETAQALKVHPGVYCPSDKRHVSTMFELQPPNDDASTEGS